MILCILVPFPGFHSALSITMCNTTPTRLTSDNQPQTCVFNVHVRAVERCELSRDCDVLKVRARVFGEVSAVDVVSTAGLLPENYCKLRNYNRVLPAKHARITRRMAALSVAAPHLAHNYFTLVW